MDLRQGDDYNIQEGWDNGLESYKFGNEKNRHDKTEEKRKRAQIVSPANQLN